MKKSKKSFILIGMATAAIGITAMLQTVKPFDRNIALQQTKTYNHRPENILDNVFTEGNTKYLPFIFEKPTDTVTKEKITTEFAKAGLTVDEIKTEEELVGTGTQITVKENNTVYNVIVYGDVDGDGYADTMDAYDIILYAKNPTQNPITGIYLKAGNICNFEDEDVDTIDAYQIILFQKGGLNQLVEVEPAPDTIKPIIELIGSSNVTIETGQSYTDPGAKATNNYGADITNRITTEIKNSSGQIVSSISTSSVGKYTITYNVSDNNGNTALPVTRTVEVKSKSSGGGGGGTPSKPEVIHSIEMKDLPKQEYNYGEELNLTGGTITVNSSKGTRVVPLTDSKVTIADKDLSNVEEGGTKTISVSYKGAPEPTSFEVTVLKKIIGLEFIKDANVSLVDGKYEVDTDSTGNTEVILGNITQTHQEGGSILQEAQLANNIQVELVSSDSEGGTANNLTISTKVENGKILLIAKATKSGDYTVNVSIKYGEEVIALTPAINVKAVKSNKLQSIELEEITANEIRIKKPANKTITIKNINGETITDIPAQNISFTNITSGVQVIKLNENGKPIEDETRPISALQISTTSTTAIKNATFKIEVTGAKNTISKDITFDIGEALVLSDIKLGTTSLSLNVEEKENTLPLNNKFYQVFTIEGLDQFGNEIDEDINYSDFNVITEKPNQDGSELDNLANGKITIIRPNGAKKIIRSDGTYRIVASNILDVIFLDEDGNEIQPGENKAVKQIGIALLINESSYDIVPSSLEGKAVKIAMTKENTKELPITVNYKTLKQIDLINMNTSNVTITETENNYNADVKLNKEFILGTIEPGRYQGPLTATMLSTTINDQITNDGMVIDVVEQDGNIVIKGTVSKPGNYTIKVNAGSIPLRKNIKVQAERVVQITDITLSDTNVQIGKVTTADLTAISAEKPNGEQILVKNLNLEYDNTIINVTKLGESGIVQNDEEEVKKLQIEARGTTNTTTNLKITVYEKEVIIPIQIYNSIPMAIDMESTVNLYESEVEGKTATAEGKIYTLLEIKAYADIKKTKPITLTGEMMQRATTGSTEEQNKIYFTVPKVEVKNSSDRTRQAQIVDVQYFGENKETTTTGDIKYIGFAIIPANDTNLIYENTLLNGIGITFKCTANTETSEIPTVTTVYSGTTTKLPQEGV